MEKEEMLEKLSEFFHDYCYDDLVLAATEQKKCVVIDFSNLDKFNPDLADYLLENPDDAIQVAEESIKTIDLPGDAKLRVRFFNLPESKQIRIRNIRAEHIGKLISVDGMVKRASEIRPEVSEAIFSCPECGNRITIIQIERIINSPIECERCENRKGFRFVDQRLYDARWISLEEPFEITSGERPSGIMVFLKEDLTTPKMQNVTDPGNRIKIVGVLKNLPKRMKGTRSRQMEIFIDANSVETVETEWEELIISPEDEKRIVELSRDPEIFSKLVRSIAPSIYGLEDVKEAIALQLFTGVPLTLKDKSRVRGDIHILLVGDPSCLVADERVVMGDGTIMKIGNMGKEHLQEIDYRVHTGMGWKVGRTNRFHVYRKQPIIEIVTETGKSIKGTHNQPVLIVKNRKQSWKRMDEMKIGDKVQVIPKIKCNKKTLVQTNWKDYPYYHKSWHVKIPEFVDEDLAGLFGYIIADGWVQNMRLGFVVNKDEMDIFPKIENILKKCFDATVNTYEHKRASPKIKYYQVDRSHIAKLLTFLNKKRTPDYIFQSGNSVVASFLRWLYEGDGSVFSKGRGRTSVSLKSNNIELLRDVQILLLRFGIHSRILWEDVSKNVKIKNREIVSKPSGSLMIRRSESIIKFWQNIGFVSKKKKNKLKEAAKYARTHIRRIHKSRTEKIIKIRRLPPQDVFDIEVPKYHRFVANGIVSHNTAKSVLMKVVSTLIPRGKYVSGKGVTAAGLTATVTRDEEFLGGWVLEAGALVMTNRSLCAIDEFEKVDKSDQVALHEAMEQQSISIAKASIVATLPAVTSILAGGNPKFGRFDPYMPIKEQIDVPETILARFDLKFAMRDRPDPVLDEKIASHILQARHYGDGEIKPEIEPDFLRKYIAYARKNIKPKLTREAGEMIKQFFVQLRERVIGEEAPVPITLRQYEALIRLAQASAKVRLSETVTVEDATRAINLMKASLRQFGFDPETGKIDIDRAEGHISATERSKTRIMLDVIDELSGIIGKNIPKAEIMKLARTRGLKDFDIEKMLGELKNRGDLFEPMPGILQRM